MPAAAAEDAELIVIEPASADAADGTAAEEEATGADAADADRCILRTVWRAALRPTPSVCDMMAAR